MKENTNLKKLNMKKTTRKRLKTLEAVERENCFTNYVNILDRYIIICHFENTYKKIINKDKTILENKSIGLSLFLFALENNNKYKFKIGRDGPIKNIA